MKKILLLAALVVAIGSQAQPYWTGYATSQPAASTGMASLSIVDDNVVWANMRCGTTGCTPIRRYALSTDSGLTWSTNAIDLGAGAANLQIANICGVSATTAWASVFPSAAGATGGVWKTENGGASWSRQNSASYNSPASFTNVVYFWNENVGVTMGDATDPDNPNLAYYEIYTTVNGGENWTRVPKANIGGGANPLAPDDYGLTNQFTVRGNSIWFGTTYGEIFKSTDFGVTWSIVQSPIPDFGGGINGSESGDMTFLTESKGLLQTSDYQLFDTTDGGATWNVVNWAGALRNFAIAAIPGTADSFVSIGEDIDAGARGSSFSTDGGLNWTSINDFPEEVDLVDGGIIAFRNSNVGFASGFSTSAAVGGVFKWTGKSLSNSSFENEGNFVASLNQGTGVLNLAGANIANVVIFDILGKQVFAGNYDGLSTVDVNVASFNSGVYMVRVTNTEGSSSAIKVVKQ